MCFLGMFFVLFNEVVVVHFCCGAALVGLLCCGSVVGPIVLWFYGWG